MAEPRRGPGWAAMRDLLQRVAVGPHGSRDLCAEDAREAMRLCLSREASDVQIGVFLIAERLKRETEEENWGFLQALVDASRVRVGPAAQVVSLADPYDGFKRVPHYGPVVAAVLASCGLPACVHGVADLAPKHGITGRQVLEAMGVPLDIGRGEASVDAAAARLADPERGAAYLDLEDYCPSLSALGELREEIAKRPFLATLDKLITPLRGAEATHLVAGFVHPGYEHLLVSMARLSGFASGLIVRGREGFIDPHVHRETEVVGFRGDADAVATTLQPKGLGLLIQSRDEDTPPLTAGSVAELWDLALHRKHRSPGALAVRLLAGASLQQAGRVPTIMRGVGLAHEAIVSGAARRRLMSIGGG